MAQVRYLLKLMVSRMVSKFHCMYFFADQENFLQIEKSGTYTTFYSKLVIYAHWKKDTGLIF